MDCGNILSSLWKYFLEGFAVAIATYLIAGRKSNLWDVVMVGLTAGATFLFLDMISPRISMGARQGSGFGLGYNATQMTSTPQLTSMSLPGLGSQSPLVDNVPPPQVFENYHNYQQKGGQETDEEMLVVEEDGNGAVLDLAYGDAASAYQPTCSKTKPIPPYNVYACNAKNKIYPDCNKPNPVHYNKNCQCSMPCTSCCEPEEKCKLDCPDIGCDFPTGCYKNCCKIADNGCPYKIIPGYYSKQAILPGYNECVKPYNSVTPLEKV